MPVSLSNSSFIFCFMPSMRNRHLTSILKEGSVLIVCPYHDVYIYCQGVTLTTVANGRVTIRDCGMDE